MAVKTFAEMLADTQQNNTFFSKAAASLAWFEDQAVMIGKVASEPYLNRYFDSRDAVSKRTIEVGQMYFFFYDPKWKDTLPYYDRFPCIFPFSLRPDGSFLGINMHYLAYPLRAKLMDALVSLEQKDERTKLQISYDILNSASKYSYFKPCIKHYLPNHLRSRLILVPRSNWEKAVMLPVHQFAKASASKVWAESWKKI